MNWILIRGLARERRHWHHFPDLLQSRMGAEVICLDLPGVGARKDEIAPLMISSYANDLHEQFKKIKAASSSDWGLIAVSLGGMIGLDWVARFESDFKHLVTINTSAGNLSLPTQRLSFEAIQTIGKLFCCSSVSKRERSILELTTNMIDINQDLVDLWVGFDRENPLKRQTFVRQLIAAATFKVPHNLKIKPLILLGQKDRLTNPICSKLLATHLKCSYIAHENAGHDLALDDPKWIVDQIENFLKTS